MQRQWRKSQQLSEDQSSVLGSELASPKQ
jgi:hypothetical protein